VDFDAHGRHILLVELASAVALHEGGLADTAVADEDELKLGRFRLQSKLVRCMHHQRKKTRCRRNEGKFVPCFLVFLFELR
jgi:hypothetical protein